MEGLDQFKQAQKESWKHFAPLEAVTTPAAARLVQFAGVATGMRVLDVGCGTGVVADHRCAAWSATEGRRSDSSILERARENARLAEVDVEFSRPTWKTCLSEMESLTWCSASLRTFSRLVPRSRCRRCFACLRPGGTDCLFYVASGSRWWGEPAQSRRDTCLLRRRGLPSPILWGDTSVVQQRLGECCEKISFLITATCCSRR